MTIDQWKAAYFAEPFRPFMMHLADGRAIPVQSKEFMMTVPSGRNVVVAVGDDAVNIVDLLLVTDLEFKVKKNGSTNGTKRRKKL